MNPPLEWRTLPDRSQPRVDVPAGAQPAEPIDAWARELQRILRPGGTARLLGPAPARAGRMREALGHYFDVGPPGAEAWLTLTRRRTSDPGHFEQIAPEYWASIPQHVQDHFLAKKTELLRRFVKRGDAPGLDLGCGVGRYAVDTQRHTGHVIGVDPSRAALREGRRVATPPRPEFIAADALRLPFKDESFAYVYTINVLHHLKRGEQERALEEVRRLLRPGGMLLVHEMNIRNPVFRWYLRYLYPKIRPIDKGDEDFIHPARWPLTDGWKMEALEYATFVPDFVPKSMFGVVGKLETWLEKSAARPYSAHYMVALRKD